MDELNRFKAAADDVLNGVKVSSELKNRTMLRLRKKRRLRMLSLVMPAVPFAAVVVALLLWQLDGTNPGTGYTTISDGGGIITMQENSPPTSPNVQNNGSTNATQMTAPHGASEPFTANGCLALRESPAPQPGSQAPVVGQTLQPGSQAPVVGQTLQPGSQAPVAGQTQPPGSQAPVVGQTQPPGSQAPVVGQTLQPGSQAPVAGLPQPIGGAPQAPGPSEAVSSLAVQCAQLKDDCERAKATLGNALRIPAAVPDGFTLKELRVTEGGLDGKAVVLLYASQANSFTITEKKDAAEATVDPTSKKIGLHGTEGQLTDTSGRVELRWKSQDTAYAVAGNISAETAIQVAKSLQAIP
ncbi:DUF4367 domain-containing protein [Paenibacillus sp. HJGM_3]|uniref:DUF4367 domain-containing protein n=1 Tax=Paenibacillus sp. HJGM_3 TaxID=3379816 RepID=UPI00385B15DA